MGPLRRRAIAMIRRAADCAAYGADPEAIADLLGRAADAYERAVEQEG
jgi:hypothetical protein